MKNTIKIILEWYNDLNKVILGKITVKNTVKNKVKKGEKKMTHEFYDVKAKQKVTTEITAKTTYGEGTRVRYAVKGMTKDGRNLTAFVSKADYDKIKVK